MSLLHDCEYAAAGCGLCTVRLALRPFDNSPFKRHCSTVCTTHRILLCFFIIARYHIIANLECQEVAYERIPVMF